MTTSATDVALSLVAGLYQGRSYRVTFGGVCGYPARVRSLDTNKVLWTWRQGGMPTEAALAISAAVNGGNPYATPVA